MNQPESASNLSGMIPVTKLPGSSIENICPIKLFTARYPLSKALMNMAIIDAIPFQFTFKKGIRITVARDIVMKAAIRIILKNKSDEKQAIPLYPAKVRD
jgi:hypothetical protein